MSSYTKKLIEMANDWVKTNPDPNDPFLRVPEYVTIEDTMQTLESAVNNVLDGAGKLPHSDTLHGRFLLSWARDGFNVIELSPDFVAAMLLTDSREIDISRARLPFRGVLMLIPDGFAKDEAGRSYTRIHLSEIGAREASMLGAAAEVDAELGKLPPEQAQRVLARVTAEHQQAESKPDTPLWAVNSPVKLTSPAAADRLYISASCGQWSMFHCSKRDSLTWDSIDEAMADVKEDADVLRTIQSLVFATLAYISSVSKAVEPVVEQPTKKRKPSGETQPKRWVVGRTIKLDPNLVRTVRAGSREVAFRLKHRHIVRGHYKQQPHGPNRLFRKEIYVQAYWKGPEDGATLVHTYKPQLSEPVRADGAAEPEAAKGPPSR